jgi:DNA mismatch endonuclease (patch repair protein)
MRFWHDGYDIERIIRNYQVSNKQLQNKLALFCESEFFHGKDWDKLKVRLNAEKTHSIGFDFRRE